MEGLSSGQKLEQVDQGRHGEVRQVNLFARLTLCCACCQELSEDPGVGGDDRDVSKMKAVHTLYGQKWSRVSGEGLVYQVHPEHRARVGLNACPD